MGIRARKKNTGTSRYICTHPECGQKSRRMVLRPDWIKPSAEEGLKAICVEVRQGSLQLLVGVPEADRRVPECLEVGEVPADLTVIPKKPVSLIRAQELRCVAVI